MIQAAAPFILPLAEALGLSVATLGMAKVTDEVNKYVQENPEQAQKLLTTIMPAQGIATMFKGDDDNLPEKTDEEKTPQEEPPEDPNVLPEIAKELTLEKVRSDVKFKKSKYKDVTDVFYKGKKYAEIEKRDEEPKFKGITDYNLKFPSGYFLENGEEIFQTEDAQLGFKDAKEVLINSIFRDFKNRNKKAKGGMIDKSLPGRSRYI